MNQKGKTTFRTTSGHYMFQVMPYGLSGALSVFQFFINYVLRDFLGKTVVAYIDDTYSPDYESHVRHVKQVLTKLWENKLYIKVEKCEFNIQRTKVFRICNWTRWCRYGSRKGQSCHYVAKTHLCQRHPVLHWIRKFLPLIYLMLTDHKNLEYLKKRQMHESTTSPMDPVFLRASISPSHITQAPKIQGRCTLTPISRHRNPTLTRILTATLFYSFLWIASHGHFVCSRYPSSLQHLNWLKSSFNTYFVTLGSGKVSDRRPQFTSQV